MARKNYSDEFRRQAVDLYESTPGATVRGIADDLGVERGTLRHWLDLYGTGKKTAADGTPTRSPLRLPGSPGGSWPSPTIGAAGPLEGETPEQRIARLEARIHELEAETTRLTTEREILRSAAKYFAGETNW
jgi:transposase